MKERKKKPAVRGCGAVDSLPACQESLGGVRARRSRSLSGAETTRGSGSKDARRDPGRLHKHHLLGFMRARLRASFLFCGRANVSAASSRTQIYHRQINHFSPSPSFRGVIAELRTALTPYGRGGRPMAGRGAARGKGGSKERGASLAPEVHVRFT